MLGSRYVYCVTRKQFFADNLLIKALKTRNQVSFAKNAAPENMLNLLHHPGGWSAPASHGMIGKLSKNGAEQVGRRDTARFHKTDQRQMKCLVIVLVFMMTVSDNINASDKNLVGIDSLRWKYRVILVSARDILASNAVSNLEERAGDIEERDIAWFVLGNDALHTNYNGKLDENLREQLLESYFTPEQSDPTVLLIGKDGQIKSRSPDLDLEATFGLIDQMPMRQQEVRRQRDELD